MIRNLWPLLVGFALWALAFVLHYALQYLGCYFNWPPTAHRAALIIAYALSLAAITTVLVVQFRRQRREGSGEMSRMGTGATIASFAATAISLGPALLISTCK